MATHKDKKIAAFLCSGFGPVPVYTQMVEANLKPRSQTIKPVVLSFQ